MMYKRRWFLRLEEFRLLIAGSVATIAAMKSGLKAHCVTIVYHIYVGVATIAAMKSGLKDPVAMMMMNGLQSSNHCRDEKRTESQLSCDGWLSR